MNHIKNRFTFRFLFANILLFGLFTLISCNQTKQESGQTQQLPVEQPSQEEPAPVSTEPTQPVAAEAAEQPSTPQTQSEVMLNPPHGEPYHRCDIPVGAPLNTAPANTTRQTTNNQAQVAAPQSSVSAPSTANNPIAPTVENDNRMKSSQAQNQLPANDGSKPRLNPPHGQPHHRCDIAVGSPLP